jgi:FdhD protein
MPKPDAPRVQIRKWDAGRWNDQADAVVPEEPLELLLDGQPLSVMMRTPGNDVELALGLLYSEGIIRTREDVRLVRMSAESAEAEAAVPVEAAILESNQVDVRLVDEPRRKLERSMLSTSACGVCGAVMIEDLKRDLRRLRDGMTLDPAMLPPLADRLRSGQSVFDRTGGLHAACLFTASGALVCLREDIGRHNAVDKVVGRLLLDGRLPASDTILVVSGRSGYEVVQKSVSAGIPLLAAVGAPSSLAVALAAEFNQTLVGFLRGGRYNVYSAPQRLA